MTSYESDKINRDIAEAFKTLQHSTKHIDTMPMLALEYVSEAYGILSVYRLQVGIPVMTFVAECRTVCSTRVREHYENQLRW